MKDDKMNSGDLMQCVGGILLFVLFVAMMSYLWTSVGIDAYNEGSTIGVMAFAGLTLAIVLLLVGGFITKVKRDGFWTPKRGPNKWLPQ